MHIQQKKYGGYVLRDMNGIQVLIEERELERDVLNVIE